MKALREKLRLKCFPMGKAAPFSMARAAVGSIANPLQPGEQIFFFFSPQRLCFIVCILYSICHSRDDYMWSGLFSHVAFQVSNNTNCLSTKLAVSFTPKYSRWCFINKSPTMAKEHSSEWSSQTYTNIHFTLKLWSKFAPIAFPLNSMGILVPI